MLLSFFISLFKISEALQMQSRFVINFIIFIIFIHDYEELYK